MRRTLTIATTAAVLALAACSSSTKTTASGDQATNPTVGMSTVKVITTSPAPAASRPAATKAGKASKSATPSDNPTPCGPNRDIVVRYKVPGLEDSAQILGSWEIGTCKSTFDSLQQTAPKDAGYCTWAAYGSDNPGYNADETPAKPLKKVVLAVGPAC